MDIKAALNISILYNFPDKETKNVRPYILKNGILSNERNQIFKIDVATGERNSRNEIKHSTNDEIGVAVKSWL